MSTVKQSIEVWVLTPNREVLLLHVPALGAANGFWQPVTGGIETGETAATAAARELAEETALLASSEMLELLSSGLTFAVGGGLVIEKSLFVLRTARQLVTLDPAEHDASAWVTWKDVDQWLHWHSNLVTWDLVRRASDA